jgi:hypothetical protein
MAITRTAIIDDDGSGKTGTVIDNAWKQEFYNQIDALAGGAWANIPFSAANFTATGATWTVTAANQETLAWCRSGNTIFLSVCINGTSTLSAASPTLKITLPGLPGAARHTRMPYYYYLSNGTGTGYMELLAGTNIVAFARDLGGTPFPTGAGSIFLWGGLFYSV